MRATRVSIDSRSIQPGETYIALRGENHDGHDFVEAALRAGAEAAVVEASAAARYPPEMAARLRIVPDTLRALQDLARDARRRWGGPVVAVTGSAGKTTTKEMISAVLATQLRTLKSEGNRNNHIGVPLTLLRLAPEHQVAVVEMGMNHAGEIARLAEIAEPTIGVFTNVGNAHVGNFGSIAGVAAAKRELALAIPADGALVLNADDPWVARFGEGFRGRTVFYPGERSQANEAAAVATGGLFGIEETAARRALAAMPPRPGRGQVLHADGMALIDDSYNANPEAMEYMLQVLAATPGARHIAVLGEMRELGTASEGLHRRLGEQAARVGLDALFGINGDARFIVEGARAAGFAGEADFIRQTAAAAARLRGYLQPGDTVLFKGSRAVKLETVLAALTADR